MIDNLKGQEELEVKKLKVTKADIVVKGNVDKPYYVIVYHEVGKDYDNEGFGSYYLENVFKWRDEELEMVDEKKQPKTDWIPCEERLPEQNVAVLVSTNTGEVDVDYYGSMVKDFIGLKGTHQKAIAWQPLPQPYKKEGAE